VKKQIDDWGTGLGADPDRPAIKPAAKGDTRTALVYFFRDSLPSESMDRITSAINAPALMKGFAKLSERGFTNEQIRGMIMSFVKEISRRPLPVEVAPWRAFLANLDKYAKEPNVQEDTQPTSISIDPRLTEE
jgi:hypothetical protein